jgi:hypothetical protein
LLEGFFACLSVIKITVSQFCIKCTSVKSSSK